MFPSIYILSNKWSCLFIFQRKRLSEILFETNKDNEMSIEDEKFVIYSFILKHIMLMNVFAKKCHD